jgi:hypothetical protein
MYKILFVLSGHDSAYHFQAAEQLLNERYPNQFKLDLLLDTNKIDEDQEEFARCLQSIEASDFVFFSIHNMPPAMI